MASRSLSLYPTILLIAAALAVAGAAHASLADGLIAQYSFNGHTMDVSGNGNHGTAAGGFAFVEDRHGTQGAAGEFNGTNSYVLVPNSSSLDSPDTAVTQAAWVHLYGASLIGQAFGPVLMKSFTSENAFMYRMTTSPGSIGFATGNWFNATGVSMTIPLGEWHHVATVYDGSSVVFYYDGADVGTLPLTGLMAPDGRPLVIGGDVPGILEIFYGRLDDVRIYDRALSPEEIAELFGEPVAVDLSDLPPSLALEAPAPNPSRRTSRVAFTLPVATGVEVWVQDVRGRRVRTLERSALPAGAHAVVWNGRDDTGRPVSPGLYFLRVRAGAEEAAARILRLP